MPVGRSPVVTHPNASRDIPSIPDGPAAPCPVSEGFVSVPYMKRMRRGRGTEAAAVFAPVPGRTIFRSPEIAWAGR